MQRCLPTISIAKIYPEPEKCRLTLLGTLPASWNGSTSDSRLRAIIRIEKNAFASENAPSFFEQLIHKMEVMESTDIVRYPSSSCAI